MISLQNTERSVAGDFLNCGDSVKNEGARSAHYNITSLQPLQISCNNFKISQSGAKPEILKRGNKVKKCLYFYIGRSFRKHPGKFF